ncbi:MAG: hypothetical protein JWM78_3568 [Verrucomicrobiaceae bacterium]|nr:hypothetical protein [Verrucomicrobiaceae bacterium]
MRIANLSFYSRRTAAVALLGALAFNSVAGYADDAAPAPVAKTEKCLMLNRIRQTRVVDDNTVLFYLTQNQIYKNVMPHKCSGLGMDQTFLYKSSINQLCSVDTITPLISTGGAYMPTTNCGLGNFELIDKATAETLLKDAKAAR